MPRIRMDADVRKRQLLEAAYDICKHSGIKAVTRPNVAKKCNVTDGLINRYFDGRDGLRQAVMEHAVTKSDAKTLAACAVVYELPRMSRNLAAAVKAHN